MQRDQGRSPSLLLCRDDLKLGLANGFVGLELCERQAWRTNASVAVLS
jgi:hypothetical protein